LPAGEAVLEQLVCVGCHGRALPVVAKIQQG
jgi:hypothetical protein